MSLIESTLHPRFAKSGSAVRGPLTRKALAYKSRLLNGDKSLPFKEITECNIGNPHALGQKPLTCVRQMLALLEYPPVAETGIFHADLVSRSRQLRIPGGMGAYSETHGLKSVRKSIARFIEKRDGFKADPDNIFLTNGASAAIQGILDLCIKDDSDVVLLPVPQYTAYSGMINYLRGHFEGYYLDENNDWQLDIEHIYQVIRNVEENGRKVRAIVVINPGNPTGNTLSLMEQENVVQMCLDKGIALLADEVYQENVYCGSFSSFRRVVKDRPVELFSFHSISKGFFGECGKRGGYVECYNIDTVAMNAFYNIMTLGLCANVTGQIVMELMVNPPQQGDESYTQYLDEKNAILKSLERRAILFCNALNGLRGVMCHPPTGSMYLFPRFRFPDTFIVKAREDDIEPDALFAEMLLDSTGICAVAGSSFQQLPHTHHLRIAFLPTEENLPETIELLKQFYRTFINEYE